MTRNVAQVFSKAVRQKELDRYTGLILAEWQKATASIMAVAKTCSEANGTLSAQDKRELFKRLPFGQSVFSKLAAIGSDTRLQKPRLLKLLPPNYSTIYEVSHLSDAKLGEAIKGEIITPKASRSDIVSFAKGAARRRRKHIGAANHSVAFFAEIKLPSTADAHLIQMVNGWMRELENQWGAEVVRLIDLPAYDRLVARYQRNLDRHHQSVLLKLKSLVRKRVIERKKEAKQRGARWGFESDETDLNVLPGELEERIRRVLQILGEGDNYSALHSQAERLADMSAADTVARKLGNLFPFAESLEETPQTLQVKSKGKSKSTKRDFSKLKV